MKRSKVCCFTGHRNIPHEDLPRLIEKLDQAIADLILEGVVFFGSGMARGFDTLAAQAVLKAGASNGAVKLIAVLPCYHQESLWGRKDQRVYRQLVAAADKAVYVSKQPYYNGCMEKRNLHLVENSGVCIAYMKAIHSGTAQTVHFAQKRGLRILNLAEKNPD